MKEDSAERAARLLLAGAPPGADGYRALRARVLRYLHSVGITSVDADDIADEVLTRGLLTERKRPEIQDPIAYILRSAYNAAADRKRRHRAEPVDPMLIGDWGQKTNDDALLKLLDRELNLQLVRGAFKLANGEKDVTCLLVVQTWLDLAETQDAAPSSRDVGAELGLAHTTVQRALARFRDYVERVLAKQRS